jgi:hypothetical protein
MLPAGFQEADRPPDIHVGVKSRVLKRRPDSGPGGQMDNPVDLLMIQYPPQQLFIAQVPLD